MKKEEISKVFPFGQTMRVGNFKMWRANQRIKTANGSTEVEVVNVSNLSGDWSVRIPSTYEMYNIIVSTYIDTRSEDENIRMRSNAVLRTILSNMMYVSVVGNGYFQRGVEMVATVYANPSLLSKDSPVNSAFFADIKETVTGFLEWRKEYDKEVKKHEPTDEEMRQEDIAEQAAEILTN